LRIFWLSLILFPCAFGVIHLPIALYAHGRGFEREFWQQYPASIAYMGGRLLGLTESHQHKNSAHPYPSKNLPETTPGAAARASRNERPLPPIKQLFHREGKKRELTFLIYWPPVGAVIMLGLGLGLGVFGWKRRERDSLKWGLSLIVGIGGAMTLFPQYFLFRPDPPHLSEMMCVYAPVSVAVCALLLRMIRVCRGGVRVAVILILFFSLFHIYIYLYYGLRSPWMGSIALRKKDAVFVHAENGVSGYIPKDRAREFENLIRAITSHSRPGDYMVCYPYEPMAYFMTGRRSYLYNLYVDNATSPIDFDRTAIEGLEKYQPSIAVIDDQAMNLTQSSRFSAWAPVTLGYIKSHYRFITNTYGVDVYARIP
jgi:hypothetical protein